MIDLAERLFSCPRRQDLDMPPKISRDPQRIGNNTGFFLLPSTAAKKKQAPEVLPKGNFHTVPSRNTP